MDNLFTDQLRSAIRDSEMSLGAISQSTAIDKAVLSRFMNGKSGLSVTSIDRLCTALGLSLVSSPKLSNQRKRPKMIAKIAQCITDQIRETGRFSADDGTPYYRALGNHRSEEVIVVGRLSAPGLDGFICTIDFDEDSIRIFRHRKKLVTRIDYADPKIFDLLLQTIDRVNSEIPPTAAR